MGHRGETLRLAAGADEIVEHSLKRIWADAAYRGKELANWCQRCRGRELKIVGREPGAHGYSV